MGQINARRKDSTEIVEIDGEKKLLWKCNCGAEKIYPSNSGRSLGLKVAWWTHFEEVIKRKKRK